MPELFGFDAFSPPQIAERVTSVGLAKAKLPTLQTLMLGLMAGVFIGLGATSSLLVLSDAELSFAVTRFGAGLVFSLGLILVVVAGAELFTGNNLLVMAWREGRVTTALLLRNWALVYASNAVGAMGLALAVHLAHLQDLNQGALGVAAVKLAAAKTSLPLGQAVMRGVLCNLLVCLAVWIAIAGRCVSDKIVAIVFPVTAFVAAGFEHSIANLFFVPLGMLLHGEGVAPAGVDLSTLTWLGFVRNLAAVTVGNIVGGSVLVALVYRVIYQARSSE